MGPVTSNRLVPATVGRICVHFICYKLVIASNRAQPYRARVLRIILNNKPAFWLLLSVPAVFMLRGYIAGDLIAMDMLHPTGEWAARFMIFAMILSPLVSLFGQRKWLGWLVQRRRSLGLAAFAYAMLHLIFYIIDMGNLKHILDEILVLGIWTGWAAMLLFVPLAVTSNDRSMRALKAGWKKLQRLVYPAAILVLVHWIFIHNNIVSALIHFIPLGLLVAARFFKTQNPKGA